ncbi:MAG: hypothetical protein HQL50_10790 [Magnetococcales bacterium]|nr:hypothetical protein [Magnetococcales bacterium]
MTKRMLVDASHSEEVRIAVVQDQKLIDLDIETSTKEQIKGNIYLAKVTRVELSLQAAFVDFNGGRQGFLSVSDLNPKYYPPLPARSAKRRSSKKMLPGLRKPPLPFSRTRLMSLPQIELHRTPHHKKPSHLRV